MGADAQRPGRTLEASADGSTIYVAGDFTQVNGTTRNRGRPGRHHRGAQAFNPNVNAHVNSLALSGDTLYVGGAFTVVGNQGPILAGGRRRRASGALRVGARNNLEVRAVVVPAGRGRLSSAVTSTT